MLAELKIPNIIQRRDYFSGIQFFRLKITSSIYQKARINVFKQSFQYTVPYLMLIKNLQICHVLILNSKSMLLIASMLLLSKYIVNYTFYYFNDFIIFDMY